MEWSSLIIGVVFGGIASWIVTHFYYKKSTREQIALYGKLSADVRTAILDNPHAVVRHEELLEILEELKRSPIDASRLRGRIDGGTF